MAYERQRVLVTTGLPFEHWPEGPEQRTPDWHHARPLHPPLPNPGSFRRKLPPSGRRTPTPNHELEQDRIHDEIRKGQPPAARRLPRPGGAFFANQRFVVRPPGDTLFDLRLQLGVVIHVDKEEDRLGGAAAFAMIAAGFGARVTLAGVLGRDEPSRRLEKLIAARGIEPRSWIDDGPTTWKQGVIARGQLRPDRCKREVTTPINNHAVRILSTVSLGDILLVSDCSKGVCAANVLHVLGNRARSIGVPMLVDPTRGRMWSEYGSVDVINANWADAVEVVKELCRPLTMVSRPAEQNQCVVIVTIGRQGMVCAEHGRGAWYMPAQDADRRTRHLWGR